MSKVLYLCTGNTCRSPMAEVIGRRIAPHIEHASAGVNALTGEHASPHALALFPELRSHRARYAGKSLQRPDMVYAMTDAHARVAERLWPKARVIAIDVSDPYGGTLATYRTTAQQIETALRATLPRPSYMWRIRNLLAWWKSNNRKGN